MTNEMQTALEAVEKMDSTTNLGAEMLLRDLIAQEAIEEYDGEKFCEIAGRHLLDARKVATAENDDLTIVYMIGFERGKEFASIELKTRLKATEELLASVQSTNEALVKRLNMIVEAADVIFEQHGTTWGTIKHDNYVKAREAYRSAKEGSSQ